MVSRALNGTGKVARNKREAILQCAREMRYRPDPRLGYLSNLRWGGRPSGHVKIAYLCAHTTPGSREKLPALRSHAERLGYGIEAFELDHDSAKRIDRLLYHRGIQGVLFDSYESKMMPALDWQNYSAVVIGDEHPELRLHRVSTDWASVFDLLAKEARRLKARTVAVVLHQFDGSAMTRDFIRETLLLEQELRASSGARCRHRFFTRTEDQLQPRLTKWLDTLNADCVITCSDEAGTVVSEWIKHHPTARHLDAIDLGLAPRRRRKGIDIQLERRIRLAVELLHLEMLHDRRGLPEHPVRHLVPARWRRRK